MNNPEWRPILTDYRPYAEALADKLNEDGIYKMNITDVVKIALEQALQRYCPNVIINKKRKLYIRLEI